MTTPELSADVRGHCYCGAFHFLVRIPAGERPIFSAYCHCDSCRRAHAAPLYHAVCIDADYFEVTSGTEHVEEFTKTGGKITRAFTRCCGTRVLNRFATWRPNGTVPLVFFPDLLAAESRPLPEVLRPTHNNAGDECALDQEFLRQHVLD